IHPYLAGFREMSTVKNRRTGRHKDLILDCAAGPMRIWADQAVITDLEIMFGVTSQYRILENDALAPDRNRSSFRYYLGPKENPASFAHGCITTDNGVRRHIHFRRDVG